MAICNTIIGFVIAGIVATVLFISELKEREETAIKAQKTAEAAKIEAENSLFKYEKEKHDKELINSQMGTALTDFKNNVSHFKRINKAFNKLLVASSISSTRKFDFEAAMNLCEAALENDPNDYNALAEKGMIHLLKLEFTAATNAFNACLTEAPHIFDLVRVTQKYKTLKPDDNKKMSLDMKINFVRDLPDDRNWLKMFLLIRDRQTTKSMTEHSELVKNYLDILNPDLNVKNMNFHFKERPEGNHLSLAGNENLRLLWTPAGRDFLNKSILKTLNLKSLDLSNSGVYTFGCLQNLGLEELIIRGKKPNNLDFLEKFNSEKLKRILVNKGQIKEGLEFARQRGISVIDEFENEL